MSGALQERFSRIAAFKPVVRREPVVAKAADCRDDLLARIGGEIGRNHYGEYVVSRQWYATPQMCEPSTEVLRLLLPLKCDRIAGMLQHAIDPEKWLFVDTETTGLAGGTGTLAFMVGIARIERDVLAITQWVLEGFSGESAMLDALSCQLLRHAALASYNGKSFDVPLLRTRFALCRRPDAFRAMAHADLFHAARRIARHRACPDLRLASIESHWLGSTRADDLPGSAAPAAWRRWLSDGVADELAAVVRHNRRDLIGLAALTAWAGRISAGLFAAAC